MKIVFMGTPDFAVGALDAIVQAGHEVTLVVTQPDRQKGRGKEVAMSPVKETALKYNLPVFQPVRIKAPEAVAELRKVEADAFVVAAFGQILSKEILEMPPLGCINIHGSLLPKYRGSAPIQRAVIEGEKETGITIMQMDEGIDTGDILMKRAIPIEDTDTGESMFEKLAALGSEMIVEALPLIAEGKLTAQKQDDSQSSYAKMLTKDMGDLDFGKSARELDCLIRGLNSWPSAYTRLGGKTLKIWEAKVTEGEGRPGSVLQVTKDAIEVATGNGALAITSLQLEGKKRMQTKDFLLGYQVKPGDMLG
ncbi:MAG: methionyl-tRNA formyltransferase [Lachnospiraceae bacterium]|nr:methionyl-tRNA formyltransferase [Lachnospiraceae bacterium]